METTSTLRPHWDTVTSSEVHVTDSDYFRAAMPKRIIIDASDYDEIVIRKNGREVTVQVPE